MPDTFDRTLPFDTGWRVSVPSYLAKVRRTVGTLATLDVHAIAFSTYVANCKYDAPSDVLYEMSYLFAWLYEVNADWLHQASSFRVVETQETWGTAAIARRRTLSGLTVNAETRQSMPVNELETDLGFSKRLGSENVFQLALAAEEAEEAYNPDDFILKAYLRHANPSAFKSFLRRSFLREDLMEDMLATSMAFEENIRYANYDKESLDFFTQKFGLTDSIARSTALFVEQYESVEEYLNSEEVSEECATAVMADLVESCEVTNSGLTESIKEVPVTVITLNAHTKLIEYLPLDTLIQALTPQIANTSNFGTEISREFRHILVLKDMKGRFKTKVYYDSDMKARLNFIAMWFPSQLVRASSAETKVK
jgi:hypothetical protein